MLNIPWWDGRRNNLHCLKPIALSMVAGASSYWRERRASARRAWPRNFSIVFRREVRSSSPLAVMKARHISHMVRSSRCYALLLLKKATSTSWMSCRKYGAVKFRACCLKSPYSSQRYLCPRLSTARAHRVAFLKDSTRCCCLCVAALVQRRASSCLMMCTGLIAPLLSF